MRIPLHNNDILRAEKVNLKKEMNSLKLQIKEQQEEVLRLKTEFAKTSTENNLNDILKTRKAKDIENYSHVESIGFKCEGKNSKLMPKQRNH